MTSGQGRRTNQAKAAGIDPSRSLTSGVYSARNAPKLETETVRDLAPGGAVW